MAARIAWWLAALTCLFVAADVVVAAQAISLTSETAVAIHGFPFVHGACVGSALMGALIVSRYSRHPIGWLLSLVGGLGAISSLAEAWAYWVQQSDGPGPQSLAGVCAWVASLLGGRLLLALIALMYLLAPDGLFTSRRWRYVAAIPVAGALLCTAAVLSVDPTTYDLLEADESLGRTRQVVLSVGFSLVSVGMLLALASMVRRLRASTGERRQQLRWIALAAALAVVGLLVLAVGQELNGGQQTWVTGIPLFISFLLMPVLFAVSVLRYRLYELDVIINRTVVVAAGAAFAAIGYTTLVVVAGQLLQERTGGFWLSLAAMVVVALAFQPLRRFVVKVANRVAYGPRAKPYEALADFSRRLAEAPHPDDLLSTVAEAAARAVSARGARATLDVPGGSPASGTWGWVPASDEEAGGQEVVSVRTEERELGTIAVTLPRGQALRPEDLLLLRALADQTAVAFRNTSLAGDLAARVADLARTTTGLTESRRRLVEAEDAARRALEAAISRDVLPSLRSLAAEIGEARAAVSEGRDPGLEELVDRTNLALEALRDLTRGVFPAQLARAGLEPALRSLLTRAGTTTTLTVEETARARYSPRVETAIFFCCAEALLAGSGPESVDLTAAGDELVLRIVGAHDDLDLQAVRDRVEAAGGTLATGEGLLVLTVPVAGDASTAAVTPSEGPSLTPSVTPSAAASGGPVGVTPGS